MVIAFFIIAIVGRLLKLWYDCYKNFWVVIQCEDDVIKALKQIAIFTAIYGGIFWW